MIAQILDLTQLYHCTRPTSKTAKKLHLCAMLRTAVERIWHRKDSQGQILALEYGLVLLVKVLETFLVALLRSKAATPLCLDIARGY